jgi:1-aminocyclopropane-1-carboxylate deaminase/D-cysteine desulfhydrase-like pyridoxal-dependent ACC family enzyme
VPGLTGELWVKDDGLSNERYGGNKARKLGHIIPAALRAGARRIVTVGAAGSHHVLATTVFGRDVGLGVAAALFPQPWTEHAERTLRVALSRGLHVWPTRSAAAALVRAWVALDDGDYFVPPGGATVEGARSFAAAVRELRGQITAGHLPEPDVIVAAVGSGGTVAGLVAGVATELMSCRVIGVDISGAGWLARPWILSLAARAVPEARLAAMRRALTIERSYCGSGYGYSTAAGDEATRIAADAGLSLESTYTAKAFAKALAVAGHPAFATRSSSPAQRVLFWHTLSAAPLASLLETAVQRDDAGLVTALFRGRPCASDGNC